MEILCGLGYLSGPIPYSHSIAILSTKPGRSSSAQRPRPSPRRQLSVENDYPELSGDFALRGAPNSASSSDGSRLGGGNGSSSNGNVLHDSQGRPQWVQGTSCLNRFASSSAFLSQLHILPSLLRALRETEK